MLAPRCHELAVGIPHLLVLAITKGGQEQQRQRQRGNCVHGAPALYLLLRFLTRLRHLARIDASTTFLCHCQSPNAANQPQLASIRSVAWLESALFVRSLFCVIKKAMNTELL
jgi:hypothetical protein